jgi:hypothetical protein
VGHNVNYVILADIATRRNRAMGALNHVLQAHSTTKQVQVAKPNANHVMRDIMLQMKDLLNAYRAPFP